MFITLEGIEGSGKTTQMKAIAEFLMKNGHQVVTTREPGATKTGKKIRSILLDPENSNLSPLCELMLYGADRAQHIAEVVLPALKDSKVVLCDRFADATTAYQGFARGIDMTLIDQIYNMVASVSMPDMAQDQNFNTHNPESTMESSTLPINIRPFATNRRETVVLKPDLTILFDLDPAIGLERTFKALSHGERSLQESRFEQEHLDFHERVRNGYLAIAKKEQDRFLVVDASLSRENILEQILSSSHFLKLSQPSLF